jgi:hypothetical protein
MSMGRPGGLGAGFGLSVNSLVRKLASRGEGGGEGSLAEVSWAVRRRSRETARNLRSVVGVIFT